ncbi:tetratricopeptide repeat protein [Sphaerisporangium corydalis]|uniref:Tetratricopeptide repeat protein n=1 Tax=Sphaerisporangium corydalis TaxID=1441875 RepID=A0ABV9ERY9_9ACTN|nr:tetratricopeptide repeat protein [Sphaerisporangium corydalis]
MSDPERPHGRARTAAIMGVGAVGLALAVTVGAMMLPPSAPAAPSAPVSAAYAETPTSSADVAQAVKGLQARLKRLPKDHQSWAALGVAYVQQARLTADPSYYVKADEALARSSALAPDDFAVLTGQAALAAGRHEFTEAARLAGRAITVNPYGSAAYGVLTDARTQLGDYPEAAEAVARMMELKPGVASFTRASYDAELRGDVEKARELLEAGLRDAFTPEDVAYCRYYLGELALRGGDLERAGQMYDEALRSSPGFVPALAGRARAAALAGRLDESAAGYATVVARLPLAQYVAEYGEVLLRLGKDPGGQWALLKAQKGLMAANGVRDDLTWAEFEADHGSPAEAVRHAEAEYARNPNMVAADALAWALHRAGRSREALPYAKKATARGWRNALSYYHRGTIEHALGKSSSHSLSQAKLYNPHFDPKLPALARFS